MDSEKYKELIKSAIQLFWETRNRQKDAQSEKEIKDRGNRSAVTGGKQLDGFLKLLYTVAADVGDTGRMYFYQGESTARLFSPNKGLGYAYNFTVKKTSGRY